MKKSLLVLSSAALLLTSTSVSAVASPTESSASSAYTMVAAAPKANAESSKDAKGSVVAPKTVPVTVNVSVKNNNIYVEVLGATAKMGAYNYSQQKRTITVAGATLNGKEQKISVDKGIVSKVHVSQVGNDKVLIDIYAMSSPRTVVQNNKFCIYTNDIDNGKDTNLHTSASSPEAAAKAEAPKAAAKAEAPKAATKAEASKAATKAEASKAAAKAEAPKAAAKAEASKAATKAEASKAAAKAEASKAAAKAEASKAETSQAAPAVLPISVKVTPKDNGIVLAANWEGKSEDIKVKEFAYNPTKLMHTFILTPASLASEETISVDKGSLKSVRTRKVDNNTVAIDIVASAAPSIKANTSSATGISYSITAGNASKETAAVQEPTPVAVKINVADERVSFDVNWTDKDSEIKVKEFTYNPAKQMHTFIFSPATLTTPEETVKVGKGIIMSVRTRKVDNKTVAVDIMALNEPTVNKKERTSPGVSYTVNTASMDKVLKEDEAKWGTGSNLPAAAPKVGSDVSTETKSQTTAPVETPPAASTTPTAAPKVTSNVTANGPASKALAPSERVCDYFTMAGRDVQSLVDSMKGLFPNVRFQADPVLNVILVEGPAKDIAEVRNLINVQ